MDQQDQNSDLAPESVAPAPASPVPAVPSTPLPSNPPVATAITSQVLAAQPVQPQETAIQHYNRLGLGIFLTFFLLLLAVSFTYYYIPTNFQTIIYYFITYLFIGFNLYLYALPVLFFANVFIIGYLNAFASRANETSSEVGLPVSTAAPSSIASPSIDRRGTKNGIVLVLAYVLLIFTSYWIITYILNLFVRIIFTIKPLFGVSPKPMNQLQAIALVFGGVIVLAGLTLLFARLGRKYALKSSNQTTKRKSIGIKAIIAILLVYVALQATSLITTKTENIKEEKLWQSSIAQETFCDNFSDINNITGDVNGVRGSELVVYNLDGDPYTKNDWDVHISKAQSIVDSAPAELRDVSATNLRIIKAQSELGAKYGYIDPNSFPTGVYDKFQLDNDNDIQQSAKFYKDATAYCAKDLSPKY